MAETKEKKKYIPPVAVFVPIKLDEKLLTCQELPNLKGIKKKGKTPGRAH